MQNGNMQLLLPWHFCKSSFFVWIGFSCISVEHYPGKNQDYCVHRGFWGFVFLLVLMQHIYWWSIYIAMSLSWNSFRIAATADLRILLWPLVSPRLSWRSHHFHSISQQSLVLFISFGWIFFECMFWTCLLFPNIADFMNGPSLIYL